MQTIYLNNTLAADNIPYSSGFMQESHIVYHFTNNMVPSAEDKERLNWSELPDGFQNLLKRSYAEYKEILYDPSLHPRARKVPSWSDWLSKHDIRNDVPPSEEETLLNPPSPMA